MALKQTPICDFHQPVPDFRLQSTDSQWYDVDACRGDKGLLVMFISNHCPYVKAIREKLVRDCRELADLGVGCVAIMPNDTDRYPEDGMDNMREVAETYGFTFPYLMDGTQEVANAFGAVCTPDFFGYNADLQLQYRGRLDSAGSRADAHDSPRELFEAMKLVAKTGDGPKQQFPSMGCSIKWRTVP